VIDETPTPPIGIVAQQRAVARQWGTQPVQTAAARAGTLPARPYRVVIADDPRVWSAGSEESGLLGLSPSARLAAFERLTAGDSRLVVLCGHRQAAAVNREAALARSMLDARVAVVPLPGGPLGQYAMARIADQALMVPDRPTTLIVSLLSELAAELVDVGVLNSVSALDLPGIKLQHHLASYLPGPRLFAVQLTPHPFVAAIGREHLPAAAEAFTSADFGAGGARLLTAGPRPIPLTLEQQLGVPGAAHQVKAVLDLAGYWRDDEATELVVVPADPADWVAQRVPAQAGQPCGWCGESVAASLRSCVFCGHTPR
jgi:hypothetical protein